jgi:hypothetical protein
MLLRLNLFSRGAHIKIRLLFTNAKMLDSPSFVLLQLPSSSTVLHHQIENQTFSPYFVVWHSLFVSDLSVGYKPKAEFWLAVFNEGCRLEHGVPRGLYLTVILGHTANLNLRCSMSNSCQVSYHVSLLTSQIKGRPESDRLWTFSF